MKDIIRQLYRDVWDWRKNVMEPGTRWTTPDPLDALRFAYSEMGETFSAMLRDGTYARNHEREDTREKELAQCVIMLLTAIPFDLPTLDTYLRLTYDMKSPDYLLECAAGSIGHALVEFGLRPNQPGYCYSVAIALMHIAALPWFDIEKEVVREMGRLENKWYNLASQERGK